MATTFRDLARCFSLCQLHALCALSKGDSIIALKSNPKIRIVRPIIHSSFFADNDSLSKFSVWSFLRPWRENYYSPSSTSFLRRYLVRLLTWPPGNRIPSIYFLNSAQITLQDLASSSFPLPPSCTRTGDIQARR